MYGNACIKAALATHRFIHVVRNCTLAAGVQPHVVEYGGRDLRRGKEAISL